MHSSMNQRIRGSQRKPTLTGNHQTNRPSPAAVGEGLGVRARPLARRSGRDELDKPINDEMTMVRARPLARRSGRGVGGEGTRLIF